MRETCKNCGGAIIDLNDRLAGAGEHVALGECNQNLRNRIFEQDLLLDLLLRCAHGNLAQLPKGITDYETAFRVGELLCATLHCFEGWIDNHKHGREVDGCPKGSHMCGVESLPRPVPPDHMEGDLTVGEMFYLWQMSQLVARVGYPLPEPVRLPRDFNHYNDLVRRLVKEVERRRFPADDTAD